jgi:phosphotriesterase-related protein
MPSDAQRINNVLALIEHGKSEHILLSHDVHTKHRLVDFGGHGYSHILNNILPRLSGRDVSDDDIQNITVNNPKNWLKFDI